ncbi:MAG: hypothetical protein KBD21_03615 [Candidatus Pacebacteria bacterium]|nr:hypothetical protein [Candidatus Paceibacterota bacterium]
MASLTKQLQQLGFDDREAKTYLALLELGEGTMAELAKKSKIKRTTLYDIIRALQDRGLVSTAKRGERTIYIAEDPRTLDERLHEQSAVLKEALPELLSLANAIGKKPKIRYYEGVEGIKEVYRDTLEYPNQELLGWATVGAGTHFDIEYLNEVYLPKRVEKKIWVRAIIPDTADMRKYLGDDRTFLRSSRAMDPVRFPYDVEINLYGGSKVAFMSFREQTGLIIENKSIYTTLKSIFEHQWESLQ